MSTPAFSLIVSHPFPIRPGVLVWFELPEDVTPQEAERLAKHITTIPMGAEPEDTA